MNRMSSLSKGQPAKGTNCYVITVEPPEQSADSKRAKKAVFNMDLAKDLSKPPFAICVKTLTGRTTRSQPEITFGDNAVNKALLLGKQVIEDLEGYLELTSIETLMLSV